MPDREKIITEIEDALSGNLAKAGHVYMISLNELKDKALKDALILLKEQEAVEPECQIIFDVPYYFCGNCKTMLNMYAVKAKYCSNCARRVKWK